ncbi:unnamed protein product [Gongylonema pulchrum]|uniref:ALOG domain-containing protein n=1 Tax=Gongylonema pulchrum TaxID=637853 RepID=A0A183EGJ4_9BILA|nr:unnamed protein product [Gongylonema pulchrum]
MIEKIASELLAGIRIVSLRARNSSEEIGPEVSDSCKNGLDRNQTITYDFVGQNYASVIVEDWIGAFVWPTCKGYGDPPTDHYGGPLILRSTGQLSREEKNDFKKYFYDGQCEEPYHKLLDFVHKFLKSYSGLAKFVVVWISKAPHESASGLFHVDKVKF